MKLNHWLTEKPISLSLSSGLFGFFAHAGFCQALEEQPVQFHTFRGSSAGALVATALAAQISAREFSKILFEIRRQDFWDPSWGFGYLKGDKLQILLEKHFPKNFEDLRYPLEISCFDVKKMKTVALNSGPLAPAVAASCRIPLFFHPYKNDSQLLVDGGVEDHLALLQAKPNERILCHQLSEPFPWDFSRRQPWNSNELQKIQLEKIPRSSPFHMDRGPQITERAYNQSKALFNN